MSVKVTFKYPNSGYDPDREQVKRLLTLGQEYTISRIERGGWHTSFMLEEHPGEWFNSVHFEEVVNGSLQEVYAKIDKGYL